MLLGLSPMPPLELPHVVLSSGGEVAPTTNINLSGCNVGLVNTGTITAIDSALGTLNLSGQKELSAVIEELVKAVLGDSEMGDVDKQRIVESIEDISEQATLPVPERKTGRVRALLADIKNTLLTVEAGGKLWERFGSTLLTFFSIAE